MIRRLSRRRLLIASLLLTYFALVPRRMCRTRKECEPHRHRHLQIKNIIRSIGDEPLTWIKHMSIAIAVTTGWYRNSNAGHRQ